MRILVVGAGNHLSPGLLAHLAGEAPERVFLCDRNVHAAQEDAQSGHATAIDFDVDAADRESVARAIDIARPDLVVNLVGGGTFSLLEALDPHDLMRMLTLNCVTAHVIAQGFHQHLKGRDGRGSLVNVSSVNAAAPTKGYGAYSCGKAALEAYSRAAALEFAPVLRVYALRLGPVASRDGASGFADTLKAKTAVHHLIEPRLTSGRDLARVSTALHRSFDWATGDIITLDGGLTLGNSW